MKYINKHTTIIKNILAFSFLLSLLCITSCKKLVEVSPPVTSSTANNVYNTDATANAVLTGLYTNMSAPNILAISPYTISVVAGLSADELTLYSGVSSNSALYLYYANELNNSTSSFWNNLYSAVFTVNSAIQGIFASTGLTPAVRQQLLGEAYFLRGYFYFYLVSLYGDVPLVTGTDYTINDTLRRTPQTLVWQQIIADEKNAEGLLSSNFLGGTLYTTTTARLRPTKWAAMAMLARTYLSTKDWNDAKMEADSLINNNAPFPLSLVSNLKNVFLANSNEAIWQLQPVATSPTTNTQDGYVFVLPSTGPNTNANPVYLSLFLINAFEFGDQRRAIWVDSVKAGGVTYYFPYKYEVGATTNTTAVTEYTMVFRLGEQYLIRAEAEANGAGSGISAAIADLNLIRHRAGLANYAGATDQASVIAAILHERQVELFTERGSRWLDLKRTGTIDAVMTPITPQKSNNTNSWNTNWQWYPVPLGELSNDPNLAQNNGY